jgi:hypothetical protein
MGHFCKLLADCFEIMSLSFLFAEDDGRGQIQDAENLAKDWERVGGYLRNAMGARDELGDGV